MPKMTLVVKTAKHGKIEVTGNVTTLAELRQLLGRADKQIKVAVAVFKDLNADRVETVSLTVGREPHASCRRILGYTWAYPRQIR
jgi:hypothetical protein